MPIVGGYASINNALMTSSLREQPELFVGAVPNLFATPPLGEAELQVIAQIEAARQSLRVYLHEPRRWEGSLRRLLVARAIQGSNSIEGFTAALDDAAAVEAGEQPLDADDETRLALEGYRNAMTYVLQLAADQGFIYSEQLLKSLHFMMTSHDLKSRPGRWRQGVIYVRNEATGQTVYEGPDIEFVPALMAEFVESLNVETTSPAMVRAAMAHLNLLMIHPFRDGNGRMARCLQTLVLAREGVLSPVFSSVEEYLGRNTQAYYDVLAEVGGGHWQPHRDARPWLRFLLTAHLRQARTVLRRVRETERLWAELEAITKREKLPDRVIPAMYHAAMGLRVRRATYRATDRETITEKMATRDLHMLAAIGLLETRGEKRGRHYVAGAELVRVRQGIIDARDPQDLSDPFAAHVQAS